MLKHLSLSIVIICCWPQAQAQVLLPFLAKNGLTGFADTAGQVVIAPQFTEVESHFGLNDAAVSARKDGQRVRVFRNGALVPEGNNFSRAQYALNVKSLGSGAPCDTLRHLACLSVFQQKQILVHTRTGKQAEFPIDPSNGVRFWFPIDVQPVPRNNGYVGLFLNGVMRVGRPGGLLNYVDTALNLVFREDFAAVTYVNPNTYFVANAAHKVAIADGTGRFRSPFKFGMLMPSGRPDFFISNPPVDGFKPEKKGQVGLVNADGQFIIEPQMDDIRPAGEQYLIFKNEKGEGVMDFSGQVVLAPIAGATLRYATEDLFILIQNGRQRVVSLKGGSFPGDYARLTWFDKNRALPPHFHFTGDPVSGAFWPDGRLIFRDSFNTVERLDGSKKSIFKSHLVQKDGKMLVGLVDFEGKELAPRIYESIEMRWGTDVLLVKKAGLLGLKNYDGQDVLPCRFEEVDLRTNPEGLSIFGREKGQNRWQAFDASGKRLPEKDCLHPTEKPDALYYIPNVRNSPTRIIFRDGSEAAIPKQTRRMGNLSAYDSPAGIYVLSEEPDGWYLFSPKMQSLMPSGFMMPRREYNPKTIGLTGLLPVWQLNPKSVRQVPVVEGTTPPKPATEEPAPMLEKKIDDVVVDQKMEELGAVFFTGMGVLNGRGEWVIKPVENARFLPISWNLVLEYPLNGPETQRDRLRKMHRVNHAQPAVFEVIGADFYGAIERGNFRVYQQVDDPAMPGSKRTFQTWFTDSGEQLAPFKFTRGPAFLGKYNAVAAVENGKTAWLLVDEKCKEIAVLDGLDDMDMRFKDGMMTASKGGKYGLIDSLGREALPFTYSKLVQLEHGRFLSEELVFSEKYRVLNWQGKVLAESKTRPETRIDEKTGIVMVLADARTMLFAADGRPIGEVEGRMPEWVNVPDRPGYYKFLDVGNRKFWVDLRSGREFREK
ncbi:MAG TPA: WG repeat-containing protein [Saprospiraceae bacterium]|nr:WG repeat-containing protein [Saprospiraceae bacterium]